MDNVSSDNDTVNDHFVDVPTMKTFVTQQRTSLEWLNTTSQRMKLIRTLGGRNGNKKQDRVAYGLPSKVRKLLSGSVKCPRTLFRFGLHRDGLFYASPSNEKNLEIYNECMTRFVDLQRVTSTARDKMSNVTSHKSKVIPKVWMIVSHCITNVYHHITSFSHYLTSVVHCINTNYLSHLHQPVRQVWRDIDINDLLSLRCQRNPPTFRTIAKALNRMNQRTPDIRVDRPFTETECRNKWHRLFPSSQDCNMAIQYIRDLEQLWPGLYWQTESQKSKHVNHPPVLTALHIVWPWSATIMKTLSSSIFCDATFKVTIYHYKVVCITTLDGNKQHRPLMCSFIMSSSADQWSTIFDIFHRS